MRPGDREQDVRELRQILYWQWDPIGVCDAFPHNAGEYDRYAWELLDMLEHEAKEDEVAEYLLRVERESIGLTVPDERRRLVAEAVAVWFLRRHAVTNEARRVRPEPGRTSA